MTIANTIVLLKKSATPGNAPSALANGEVAINYADGKLYYKNTSGVITYISSGATTNSFATINANSSLIFATSNTDILSIAPGNNITISTNTISKTITISSTASGGSSATYVRTSFTATASQTTFSVSYTPGYIEIYANGVLLNNSDYTATNGTTVVLNVGRNAGDIIEAIAYTTTSNVVLSSGYTTNAILFANSTGYISSSPSLEYFSSNNTTVYTGNVSISNTLSVTNATQTANVVRNIIQSTTATTAQTAIDTWSTTTYRTAKYIISMTSGTNYHGIELFVVQNGTTPYITQYAEVITNTSLATFDASITSGTLSLLVNPASSTSTTYNILRDLISA
jgi:hypothetical protein